MFTIATLAAAMLAIAVACGSNPVTIATIVVDAGHIKCDFGDAGDGRDPCPDGSFCSRNTCGSTVGLCETIDSDGCAAPGYECGCDGISYYNRCVREEARVSSAASGAGCDPRRMRTILCGPQCTANHPGCAWISPIPFNAAFPPDVPPNVIDMICRAEMMDAGFPIPNPFGVCWALPTSSLASGSRPVGPCEARRCIDDFTAIVNGGVYYPCDPDASPR
jgi:hypothetical protein